MVDRGGAAGLDARRTIRVCAGENNPPTVGRGRPGWTAEVGFDHHMVKPVDIAALTPLLAGEAKSR